MSGEVTTQEGFVDVPKVKNPKTIAEFFTNNLITTALNAINSGAATEKERFVYLFCMNQAEYTLSNDQAVNARAFLSRRSADTLNETLLLDGFIEARDLSNDLVGLRMDDIYSPKLGNYPLAKSLIITNLDSAINLAAKAQGVSIPPTQQDAPRLAEKQVVTAPGVTPP